MSTSDPIAPDRLEALLRGESGNDGPERRIGALMDELTLGEIEPPAELRRAGARALGRTGRGDSAGAAPPAPCRGCAARAGAWRRCSGSLRRSRCSRASR